MTEWERDYAGKKHQSINRGCMWVVGLEMICFLLNFSIFQNFLQQAWTTFINKPKKSMKINFK